MKKSTRVYVGPLSGGVIATPDRNFLFTRGVPVDLPEDLAVKLEKEKRDDWACPDSKTAQAAIAEAKKQAEERKRLEAEAEAKAKAAQSNKPAK